VEGPVRSHHGQLAIGKFQHQEREGALVQNLAGDSNRQDRADRLGELTGAVAHQR
jgi:hypothetical protein